MLLLEIEILQYIPMLCIQCQSKICLQKKWHGILEGPFALSGEIKKNHLIVEQEAEEVG